jgi:hypothetical protein
LNSIEQIDFNAPELASLEDTIPTLREDDAKTLAWDVSRGTWPHISISDSGISDPQEQTQTTNAMEKHTTSELILTNKRERLIQFVSKTLSVNHWRYYQGFHDVAGIFLSVLGDKDVKLFQKFTRLYLIDFVLADNLSILDTIFNFSVIPLLAYMDRDAYDLLNQDDSNLFSRFCLSWILTWFSHDLSCVETTKRFFDACLASHPMFVIYATVSSIRLLTKTLNQFQPQRQSYYDFDDDDRILKLLSPKACQNLPIQEIIDGALECMRRVPPRDLLHLADLYHKNCLDKRQDSQIMHLFRPLKYRSIDSSQHLNDNLAAIAAGNGISDRLRRKRREKRRRVVLTSALFTFLFFVLSFTVNNSTASRRRHNITGDHDGHFSATKPLPKQKNRSITQTKILADDFSDVNEGSYPIDICMASSFLLFLGKDAMECSVASYSNFTQPS